VPTDSRSASLHIPFEKHVLANGLEVVLHADQTEPVVAVYVYDPVGSSPEEPGRSGYAHLFEHMLFQGSAHVPDNDHFRLIQEAGGALNGTTNQDRTNYFETLPAEELELALMLESDRMGFLLPAMTQAKLDNQRDVVMNERRQSYENRPYGLVHETLLAALYPSGHPYSWPTIGSMDDIRAATLDDVARFFGRWYGPNNATLALGGDFEPATGISAKAFAAIFGRPRLCAQHAPHARSSTRPSHDVAPNLSIVPRRQILPGTCTVRTVGRPISRAARKWWAPHPRDQECWW
jgi:predicted Zn-dependent peptidase